MDKFSQGEDLKKKKMRKQKQTSIVTHPSLSLPIDMYRGRQDSIIPFYDKFLWLYEICKSMTRRELSIRMF